MTKIPVYLLKTRSQPDDGYEEYFSTLSTSNGNAIATSDPTSRFEPRFVPVLEHQQNTANLNRLEELLRSRRLTEQYGGLIFTSQRAVEGFSDVVRRLDGEARRNEQQARATPTTEQISPSLTTPFPLYVVGPATAHTLSTLLPSPTLDALHPCIVGAHTGNGAALAQFILSHYNGIHANLLFEYYEAPRLPFIPLVGPASGQYARQRLEKDDARLRKKGLLFLVGEVRRDIIPKTLMDEGLRSKSDERDGRIPVDEWEVYSTVVREKFESEFRGLVGGFGSEQKQHSESPGVVVVFSPQGCEAMLRVLDFLGPDGRAKEDVRRDRWRNPKNGSKARRYVVATIGPTTRDHLMDTFGFEPDVCASKPSAEGIAEGVKAFLVSKGMT